MKISLHSDIHNELRDEEFIISAPDADVILFAGDVHDAIKAPDYYRRVAEANPEAQILFINGNHEYYKHNYQQVLQFHRDEFIHDQRIHFLENDFIEIDGVEFIGATLWTNFSVPMEDSSIDYPSLIQQRISDFYLIHYGNELIKPSHMVALFEKSHQFIKLRLTKSNASKRVVVTHFSPHPELAHTDFVGSPLTPYFITDCRDLFTLAPDLWCWGHTHCNAFTGAQYSGVWCESNQLGYQEEQTNYQVEQLIEI